MRLKFVSLLLAGALAPLCAMQDTTPKEDPDLPLLTALRARITGGAILSNSAAVVNTATDAAGKTTSTISTNQFSKAELFLSFESQPQVFRFGNAKTKDKRSGAAVELAHPRYHIDPILNIRMTSIGVDTKSVFNGDNLIVAPTGSFVQGQKAVQIHLGALAGVGFRQFSVGDSKFHWAVEGVGRYILQSVTDSQRAARIWNLQDDLYDAFTMGGRLTLYQQDKLNAWKPSAYVEMAGGKFQNYETAVGKTDAATTCIAKPNDCLAKPVPIDQYTLTKPWRLYIEGRLFLKNVFVGFDINNGHGKDDVRFLAGLYLDFDRFFAKPK